MTKMHSFTGFILAVFSLFLFSCSKDVAEGSVYSDICYTCTYTASTPSASSQVCNLGDTIVNITTNGVTQTFPLNDLNFEKYLDQLVQGGATCTFVDTPSVLY